MKLKFFTIALLLAILGKNDSFFSQDKLSPRLTLNYIKDYKNGAGIKAKVVYKEGRSYLPAQEVKLILLNANVKDSNGDATKISQISTNENGEVFFKLDSKKFGNQEQLFKVVLENNSKFEDLEEEVSFKDAFLKASLEQDEDSKTIKILLTDANNEPIAEENISVKLQRLYGLMQIGEDETYETDESGEIEVAIDQVLYSKNGKLDFIIKLDESDTYGTIIELVKADFGTIMESKDSYNDKTMWGSALKAPLFVLIIPNLLLLGIWGTIVLLIINLYKIFKL
ncbi:MAG: hypothetical protein GW772_05670 [Flavobacteriia bacterium]|nr:hypothetical protein [Flavobacteriia bacterium]OIP45694.1 MAG: hypothetical protein AUK46_11270 [Flavobacteriaceae bacterium CG2_30_31_66]PIV97130.1 MAG: hypothetical protein COW43_04545 [Flavobacteriaceae bacterium CG17_big_fil_post_rev_8_21_14_2_50_31_13]PIX11434.1 MAG: hypothetical protein COZ74_14080 [Flavobacteriaceae bacterium CG_4_8_14_3_um_filter_31_8]PIY14849.1 MAG: hypothetical protein COZ16_06900 [Flavobacteriaceae bacterium CG_4_10_14_3_um_filter_31_253]PIZ09576.1 MAG: hypotheti